MEYCCKHLRQKRKEKIHALSLANERYSMRLDLLTNATVVDDAIRFVEKKSSYLKDNISSNIQETERRKVLTNNVFQLGSYGIIIHE